MPAKHCGSQCWNHKGSHDIWQVAEMKMFHQHRGWLMPITAPTFSLLLFNCFSELFSFIQ